MEGGIIAENGFEQDFAVVKVADFDLAPKDETEQLFEKIDMNSVVFVEESVPKPVDEDFHAEYKYKYKYNI
jgi:hypothetical protein